MSSVSFTWPHAWPSPSSILYPQEYNDVNVGGTVALLAAMRDVGAPRVVLASSATVYGEQPAQPVHEGMRPNPGSPYAVSKIAAEQYLFTLGKLYGLQAVALRIFNAYGPGQRIPPAHAPVVPLFLKRALGGGSLVIHGSGQQSRDFVYIDDAVRGMAAASLTDAAVGQIVNIGSGEETTLQELVRHGDGRDGPGAVGADQRRPDRRRVAPGG